jgi:hypothetical protein
LEFVPSFAEKVPIWAFHGALDDVVPPKYSRDMMQEIIFKGGFQDIPNIPMPIIMHGIEPLLIRTYCLGFLNTRKSNKPKFHLKAKFCL